MTSQEIRSSFLVFFERNGHQRVASSPLVPHDDPTLLFTNAGMNQFKDVFLGREARPYRRAATSQKCMRVSGKHNDLDNVGPSLRHHTFFEMLGNFSFGDYFKQEALPLAWALLTDTWSIPADRLYATVFAGNGTVPRDDEAYDVWRRVLPADRIGELGIDDNFWQMGDTGPCGRCSEIYYFRGTSIACAEEAAGGVCRTVACGCDRYVEIWNNVFMEFDRQADGILTPLPAPSIDTGMGLERVTAVLQGHLSNYDTDLFTPLLAAIGERAGTTHRGTMHPSDVSMRVVADHSRAMTFLIADGVMPSNEWRGYVLRKIMRRAMRHGKRLGIGKPFLHTLVDTIVGQFGDAYPELLASKDSIVQVVRSEEDRFDAVLTSGLPRLEEVLDKAIAADGVVSGEAAFKLYDTYGLPRDFIEDMIEDRRLRLDQEAFARALEAQRDKSRDTSAFKGRDVREGWQVRDESRRRLESAGDRAFRGYDTTQLDADATVLFDQARREVELLRFGQSGFVALSQTPFYLEAGGQVSDVGTIVGSSGRAAVTAMIRTGSWPRLHAVDVTHGQLSAGERVTAEVTTTVRDATRRNHTATHLLHAALRRVLGPHVKQAGSLVAPDRLRFDFVHLSPVTRDELVRIEELVNEQIIGNQPVRTEVKSTREAIAAGAMALFGEKYADEVRVVSIPDFSMELCGGTHTRATGDIGPFAILSESGVAAGVRRIEAVTGFDALAAARGARATLFELARSLNVKADEVAARVAAQQDEIKRLKRSHQEMQLQLATRPAARPSRDDTVAGEDIGQGVTLVRHEVRNLDRAALRSLVDQHRDRIKSGVVILVSPSEGKVVLVVGVTSDLASRVPAGHIVKQLAPIVGGGGGGRPDFAEAGGKDASKIGDLLAASRDVVTQMLEP